MISLAFYRAPGTLADRAVRLATRSPYSHVELVDDHVLGAGRRREAWAISASRRDGGVRMKKIMFEPDHWDVLPVLGWAHQNAVPRAMRQIGAGYDYFGIAANFLLPLRRSAPRRWFCSELVADALGLQAAYTYAPGDLHRIVIALNRAFAMGETE
ncbi:hypothetical protein [Profundibacterium mesophilum]|uniref:Cytoplasmic protein n=1 Tax=Profundibacterium mesophilum KAUST100406-0324 TaxID=1037889 RepID=A0A921TDY1_9RHOB|nr:hypothetical protein [Profundibacterium mesophilum]KAF0676722.1 putative cytoplasmic protein [Profundibacterium mesophilum KAUST100406-0324]